MPLQYNDKIFDLIINEVENLKNIYPYSNNNQLYNSFVDMCIAQIIKVRESVASDPQLLLNEEERQPTNEEQQDPPIPFG